MEIALTIAVISSSFALFLQFCFEPNEIFGFWGRFLELLPAYIANPLGKCVYCQSSWFVIILCAHEGYDFITYLFALGLNFICLELYYKYVE